MKWSVVCLLISTFSLIFSMESDIHKAVQAIEKKDLQSFTTVFKDIKNFFFNNYHLINRTCFIQEPLTRCAIRFHANEILKYLFEQHWHVFEHYPFEESPFIIALRYNNTEAMRIIHQYHADPLFSDSPSGNMGATIKSISSLL